MKIGVYLSSAKILIQKRVILGIFWLYIDLTYKIWLKDFFDSRMRNFRKFTFENWLSLHFWFKSLNFWCLEIDSDCKFWFKTTENNILNEFSSFQPKNYI
jgi:hypothetical protein